MYYLLLKFKKIKTTNNKQYEFIIAIYPMFFQIIFHNNYFQMKIRKYNF